MGKFIFPEGGKNRNGKSSFFPDREKSGTGKRNFSRNGNGIDHFPVPVHAYQERENIIFTVTRKRTFFRNEKVKDHFPVPVHAYIGATLTGHHVSP